MKFIAVIAMLLAGMFMYSDASALPPPGGPYGDGEGGMLIVHETGSYRFCSGGVCMGCYNGDACLDVPGDWRL